jgi:hypothetical protein
MLIFPKHFALKCLNLSLFSQKMNFMVKNLCVVLAFFLLAGSSIVAQKTIISGTVTDAVTKGNVAIFYGGFCWNKNRDTNGFGW